MNTLAFNDAKSQVVAVEAQTTLTADFPIASEDECILVLTRSGSDTVLELSTDFTIAGVGVDGGFTIELEAAAEDDDLYTIYRVTSAENTDTRFSTSGKLSGPVLNQAIDRCIKLAQELIRDRARTMRAPITDTADLTDLPPASVRANKILAFGATGHELLASEHTLEEIDQSAAVAVAARDAAVAAAAAAVPAAAAAVAAAAQTAADKTACDDDAASALNSRNDAEDFRDQCETIQAAVVEASAIYNSIAAGLAATVNGQHFQVAVAPGDTGLYDLYLNDHGVQSFIGRAISLNDVSLDEEGRLNLRGANFTGGDSEVNLLGAEHNDDDVMHEAFDEVTGRHQHMHTGRALDVMRSEGLGGVLPATTLESNATRQARDPDAMDYLPDTITCISDASIGEDLRLGRITYTDLDGNFASGTFERGYRSEDGSTWTDIDREDVSGFTRDSLEPVEAYPQSGQSLREGGSADSKRYEPLPTGDGVSEVFTDHPWRPGECQMPGNGMRLGETDLEIEPDDVLPPVDAFETYYQTADLVPLHRGETGLAEGMEMMRHLDGDGRTYFTFSHAKSGTKLAPLTEGTIPFEQGMVVMEASMDHYARLRGKPLIIWLEGHRQGESDRNAEIEVGSTPADNGEQYRTGWTGADLQTHGTGLRGMGEAVDRRYREIQQRVAKRWPAIYTPAVLAKLPDVIPLVLTQLCGANNGVTGAGWDVSLKQFQEASWSRALGTNKILLRGFDDDMKDAYGFFPPDSFANENAVHLSPLGYRLADEKNFRAYRLVRDLGAGVAVLCPMPVVDWEATAPSASHYGKVTRIGAEVRIAFTMPSGDDVTGGLVIKTSANGTQYRTAAPDGKYGVRFEPDGSGEVDTVGIDGDELVIGLTSAGDGIIHYGLDAETDADANVGRPCSGGNLCVLTTTRSRAVKADGTERPREEYGADGNPLDPADGLPIVLKVPGFAVRAEAA